MMKKSKLTPLQKKKLARQKKAAKKSKLTPLQKKKLARLKKSMNNEQYDAFFVAFLDPGSSFLHMCLSLRTIGLKAHMLCGKPHPFGYPCYAPIHPPIKDYTYDLYLDSFIQRSNFLFINGVYLFKKYPVKSHVNLKKTVHIAQGIGRDRIKVKKIFYKNSPKVILGTADHSGFKPSKEVLLQKPVNTEHIQPAYEFSHPTKVTVGHHPSTQSTKGTPVIYAAIHAVEVNPAYRDKLNYIGDRPPFLPDIMLKKNKTYKQIMKSKKAHVARWKPWKDQIAYYKKCDIYVETCKLKLGKYKFGAWGYTCFEAAATGCIMITNNIYQDLYKKWYGDCPVYVANTPQEITKHLKYLLDLPREELLAEKRKFRQWAVDKHSYIPTAIKMWKHVMRPSFPESRRKEIDAEVEKLENSEEYRREVDVKTWNQIKQEFNVS